MVMYSGTVRDDANEDGSFCADESKSNSIDGIEWDFEPSRAIMNEKGVGCYEKQVVYMYCSIV